MVSITNCVSLWYRPYYINMLNYDNDKNAENLRHYKSRFSLIVDQIVVFFSSNNLVRKVKNLSSNFERIT